jgi:tRNA threonylcarbamoyl adenosine modification protein YeaZ
MHTLFLDFASNKGSMACVNDDEVLSVLSLEPRTTDAKMMEYLLRAMHHAGWSHREIHRIACTTGPGGFMSLRVGVSIANALGWSLELPLAGLHLSDLYGVRMRGNGVWLHSTRREQLFIRGFGTYRTLWSAPTLMTLQDCIGDLPKAAHICGELIPEHRAQLAAARGVHEADLLPLEDVLPSSLSGLSYSSTQLRPWYGRSW